MHIRLLPHHNNVHSILKNDRTRTVIRTSKCTVPMIANQKIVKKNWKKILEIFF